MQTIEEEIDNLIILIYIKDTEFVVHNFQRENSKTVVNYTTFEGT